MVPKRILGKLPADIQVEKIDSAVLLRTGIQSKMGQLLLLRYDHRLLLFGRDHLSEVFEPIELSSSVSIGRLKEGLRETLVLHTAAGGEHRLGLSYLDAYRLQAFFGQQHSDKEAELVMQDKQQEQIALEQPDLSLLQVPTSLLAVDQNLLKIPPQSLPGPNQGQAPSQSALFPNPFAETTATAKNNQPSPPPLPRAITPPPVRPKTPAPSRPSVRPPTKPSPPARVNGDSASQEGLTQTDKDRLASERPGPHPKRTPPPKTPTPPKPPKRQSRPRRPAKPPFHDQSPKASLDPGLMKLLKQGLLEEAADYYRKMHGTGYVDSRIAVDNLTKSLGIKLPQDKSSNALVWILIALAFFLFLLFSGR